MTSCFEGLLEYYRIKKNERYKTASINYADRILGTAFTVIGCCACIGAAGIVLVPKIQLMTSSKALTINLFIPREGNATLPSGKPIKLII